MQLRWYVTQMSYERTAKHRIDALASRKRPRGRRGTRWQNYAENLAWLRIGIPLAEFPLVAKDGDAWRSPLELLPPQPQKDKRAKGNTRRLN